MKKILYLTYDGLTDPLGQSQVLSYLVKLAAKDFEITVISAEKKAQLNAEYFVVKNLCDKNQITWQYITYTKSPPIISTVIDIIKIYITAERFLNAKNFDIIHCRSYITALLGVKFKKKFGIRLIFDMRGFWADERVDGNLWNIKNPVYNFIYRFFKKKERQILAYADHVVSLTKNAKDIIDSWKIKGETKIPISVIPCCVDLELFCPEKLNLSDKNILKQQLNIKEGEFVISYLGATGTWYLLSEMLDFFKIMAEEKPASKFLFITPEEKQLILKKASEKKISLERIIVVKASRKNVPLYLSLSDASVFFIKNLFSKRASSPTKQAEIMSMGIPLICNAGIGDTDEIMKESKAGILIGELTESEYRNAIRELFNLTTYNTEKTRKYTENYFSLQYGVELYSRIYSSL